MTRIGRLTIAILACLGAGSAAHADPATDQADAVATVARMANQVDVSALSRAFRLPDLSEGLKWSGPTAGWDSLRANWFYRPSTSQLGIELIAAEWSVPPIIRPARLFRMLRIIFKPGYCPNQTALTKALGVEPRTMPMALPDGGGMYHATAYFVPVGNGDPIQVSYNEGNTCELTIGRFTDL